LDKPLDLFAEFWVRTSDSGKAIALTPTLLYYPKQLASGRNGRDPSALVLSVRLEPSGGSATAVSWAPPRQKLQPDLQVMIPARVNGASWVRQRLGDLQRICEVACETASPWAANPWAGGKAPKAGAGGLAVGVGPGTDAIEQAVNINVDFTEIRPGSKFFKALAEAFATAKPDIQSQIEQVVIADARDKAEAQATTATATALVAFAGKMSEAEEAHDKYCAAKGKPTGVLLGLSADLGAKQRLANVAAAAAELSVPFPTPAAASGTFNTSLCP
jgi:hypothetical protein